MIGVFAHKTQVSTYYLVTGGDLALYYDLFLPGIVVRICNRVNARGLFLFMISTREIACIRHSSRYAKFWQNHFLQKNPDNENSNDCNKAFHCASPKVVVKNVRGLL